MGSVQPEAQELSEAVSGPAAMHSGFSVVIVIVSNGLFSSSLKQRGSVSPTSMGPAGGDLVTNRSRPSLKSYEHHLERNQDSALR